MANATPCIGRAGRSAYLTDPCVRSLFSSPREGKARAVSPASTPTTPRSSGSTSGASPCDSPSMHTCSTEASGYSDLSSVTSGSDTTSSSASTDCFSDTSDSNTNSTHYWGHVHDTPVCFHLSCTDGYDKIGIGPSALPQATHDITVRNFGYTRTTTMCAANIAELGTGPTALPHNTHTVLLGALSSPPIAS